MKPTKEEPMETIKQKFEVTIKSKTDPAGEQLISYVLGLLIGSYLGRFMVTEEQHAAIMEIKKRVLSTKEGIRHE